MITFPRSFALKLKKLLSQNDFSLIQRRRHFVWIVLETKTKQTSSACEAEAIVMRYRYYFCSPNKMINQIVILFVSKVNYFDDYM